MATAARTVPSSSAKSEKSFVAADESKKPIRERRRHRMYVTRNTEYHFRDELCVAVRDRRTGDFLQGHLALQRRLHGGLKFFSNGGIVPNAGEPKPGEALFFAADGRDLVTSPVESIDRPSKALVLAYPEPPVPPPVPTRR